MRKNIRIFALCSLALALAVFCFSYVLYHYTLPGGSFTSQWQPQPGKPLVTVLFAILGVMFLFAAITGFVVSCVVVRKSGEDKEAQIQGEGGMIYTTLTKKAMAIAYAAHHGQCDKTGLPYIYHPMHLAEQMEDELSCCVALLHDTVEDTDVTIEHLAREGFPTAVLEAVALMTHDDAVPYMDYVAALAANPIARRVKLADLRHNSDISRLDFPDEWAMKRIEKYSAAIELLEGYNFA